jgi:head-tail adaptor
MIGNKVRFATIEQPIVVSDGGGCQTTTWVKITDVWGEPKQTKTSEGLSSQMVNLLRTFTLQIKTDRRIHGNCRVYTRGAYYNIIGITDADAMQIDTILTLQEAMQP